MKLNTAPKNCKYIVNKEQRKVVCLIENTKYSFLSFANNNFVLAPDCLDSPWGKMTMSRLHDRLLMPNRFCGIATCSENDEWDEETGKLIAYSKAKDKLNKSFFKRANLYIHTLDNEIDSATQTLNALGQKLTANTERRHEKISSLIGEE